MNLHSSTQKAEYKETIFAVIIIVITSTRGPYYQSQSRGKGFAKIMSENILFVIIIIVLVIIISFSLGMVVGALAFRSYHHSKGQGHKVNQGNRILTQCTCERSGQIYCDQHDALLMLDLSENLPSELEMLKLGLTLRINMNVIKACRVDHSNSITDAVFEMLYHKWYKTQDGLGLRSEGLKNLKRALKAPTVGQNILVESVIWTHFLKMD